MSNVGFVLIHPRPPRPPMYLSPFFGGGGGGGGGRGAGARNDNVQQSRLGNLYEL